MLEPVLTYRVLFPEEQDVHTALQKLRTLEEEDLSCASRGTPSWGRYTCV